MALLTTTQLRAGSSEAADADADARSLGALLLCSALQMLLTRFSSSSSFLSQKRRRRGREKGAGILAKGSRILPAMQIEFCFLLVKTFFSISAVRGEREKGSHSRSGLRKDTALHRPVSKPDLTATLMQGIIGEKYKEAF